MKSIIQYFYEIKLDKAILWCYLIWYISIVFFYFDPAPKIWTNSVGISVVIGTGLLLSISAGERSDRWQTFRLYLMPFCVSSFAALIKEHGFIVFISPKNHENLISVFSCALFLFLVFTVKLIKNKLAQNHQ